MKVSILVLFVGFLFYCSETTRPNNNLDKSNIDERTYTIDTLALYSELFVESWEKLDDIVIDSQNLYCLQLGPASIYQYNNQISRSGLLDSKELLFAADFGGEIEIYNSNLFIGDNSWSGFQKFYPDSGKFSYENFDFYPLVPENAVQTMYTAMTIYNDNIYAVVTADLFDTSETVLNKYDFEGNIIESYPYNKNTFWITIYDDIVFGNSCMNCEDNLFALSRYDLKTKTFMSDVSHPAKFGYGTYIYNNKFYFTDTENLFIGFVPLNAVLN